MKATAQRQLFELTRIAWETPQALFDELDAEFGFTLDVCADSTNAKCARYFDIETDGLRQDWSGQVCWMNPPYGKEIAAWVRKAATCGSTVVALLPARTDTAWWHEWVMPYAEVRFLRGRLKFGGQRAKNSAPFPSAVAVYRGAA